ncbi:MAG: BlaI/MecI/CopY family transcriptional regulator [Gemmatimonadaceae bacterium]|nr:BlaI/MecI/CopY family transcriptional regulator [Gemmatimonadaceae bacterium]
MLIPVHLTDLQLAIVRLLWTKGECTVVDVQEGLLPARPLAQTTVATLLTRLEKRGVVSHRTAGRQFIYRAEVTEPEVRRSMVGELTNSLFAGQPTALISHLLVERELGADELGEVKRMIADAEQRTYLPVAS